jgi:hypothetical protein
MNALDQQYADRNRQRFNTVADTEPTDLDEMRAAIAAHLAYLDRNAAYQAALKGRRTQ